MYQVQVAYTEDGRVETVDIPHDLTIARMLFSSYMAYLSRLGGGTVTLLDNCKIIRTRHIIGIDTKSNCVTR